MTTLVKKPTITETHFVGSLGTNTAQESFELLSNHAAGFKQLPDGEVGERWYWLQFQTNRFDRVKGLHRVGETPFLLRGQFDQRKHALDGSVKAEDLDFGNLGYADAAIDSYTAFKTLKDAGKIGKDVRFQISLPTPLAVTSSFFADDSQAAILPEYTKALKKEIDTILKVIPATELVIQWDVAAEFIYVEKVGIFGGPPFDPSWFGGDAIKDLGKLTAELVDWINQNHAGVEVGIHLCYGDIESSHFFQPATTENLAIFFNEVVKDLAQGSHINYVHLPVPIEHNDAEYFYALADLNLGTDTRLILGLLHQEDGVAGALERINAAGETLTAFGVATECGWGRVEPEYIVPLAELHNIDTLTESLLTA